MQVQASLQMSHHRPLNQTSTFPFSANHNHFSSPCETARLGSRRIHPIITSYLSPTRPATEDIVAVRSRRVASRLGFHPLFSSTRLESFSGKPQVLKVVFVAHVMCQSRAFLLHVINGKAFCVVQQWIAKVVYA